MNMCSIGSPRLIQHINQRLIHDELKYMLLAGTFMLSVRVIPANATIAAWDNERRANGTRFTDIFTSNCWHYGWPLMRTMTSTGDTLRNARA